MVKKLERQEDGEEMEVSLGVTGMAPDFLLTVGGIGIVLEATHTPRWPPEKVAQKIALSSGTLPCCVCLGGGVNGDIWCNGSTDQFEQSLAVPGS